MGAKLGLRWRGTNPQRKHVFRGRIKIAEVLLEATPEGPRWFAKSWPSGFLCPPGPCSSFTEAAEALRAAIEAGDL